jgi:D-alanyl-D-alanine carboxypeptidase/D-alanyl-D-alanine-endopeptidase (penicillin-binding protein 4)
VTDEQPTSRRAARQTPQTPVPDATEAFDPAAPADADATPKRSRGLGFRKHPTAWIASAAALVFVLLGTGAVFAGVATASVELAVAPTPTASEEPPRPVPSTEAVASRLRTCSINGYAVDPRLMTFEGTVIKSDTGEVLFDRNGTAPSRTGSVMKVFTAAAALSQLGPDFQIRTSVYDGTTPGTIVLIGRGDPTLSAGGASVYSGAPQLSDLAAQTVASYAAAHPGVPITQVIIDTNYWNPSDKWDSSWKRSEQTIGYHSEVTPLMIDGDRANPAKQTSPRSTDPIARATTAFVSALAAADPGGVVDPGVTTTSGKAISGAAVLGEVRSQPVKVLIGQMLPNSDNTLAENLARIVSREAGFNGSAASLQQAIPSALSVYGVSPTGLTIRDGSGLSEFNGVPSQTMAKFMLEVQRGAPNLDIISAALPVAGKSGTLASRFGGDAADARGSVRAKTGWIDTAYTLSGMIDAADGTKMTFAFYAVGDGIRDNAKAALDSLTAGAYRCGDNLSNN